MSEAELQQWVGANPGRVNDRDRAGHTLLYVAIFRKHIQLAFWLLDEEGANVNARSKCGRTPLHEADSLDILAALLDQGADPTVRDYNGWSPLMYHTGLGKS
jgi:hypothetical protein